MSTQAISAPREEMGSPWFGHSRSRACGVQLQRVRARHQGAGPCSTAEQKRGVSVTSLWLRIWGGKATTAVLSKGWTVQDWARNSALSRSGFPAAFAIIFVSEIGDKTFFIAALLAMKVRCCASAAFG